MLRQRIIVGLIALAATVPFLGKAFHIDDALYLAVAQQIRKNPADPYHGMIVWDDPKGNAKPLFLTDFNPPLWKYAMAATIQIFGESELPLHLLESAFVILGAFGLLEVGKRFTKLPAFAVAWIMLGPIFLPGQNVMLEGPLLCVCIWGIEFQLRALERKSIGWSLAAGVLFAIAVLIKYTSGLFWPILLVPALLQKNVRAAVFVFVPVLALAAWVAISISLYGQSHFGAQSVISGLGELPNRFRTIVHCLGATTFFAPLLAFSLRGTQRWLVLFFGIIGAVSFAIIDRNAICNFAAAGGWMPSTSEQVHHFAFACNGMLTLPLLAVVCLKSLSQGNTFETIAATDHFLFPRRQADLFLLFWFLAFLIFNLVCVPFIALRHLLFAFIPLTLLVCRQLDRFGDQPRLRTACLLLSSMLGFALAHADYQFAGTYKSLAKEQVAPRIKLGIPVLYSGGWGWSHYASHAGAMPLVENPKLVGREVLIEPMVLNWHDLYRTRRIVPDGSPIDDLRPASTTPFRTVAPNVNFYSVLPHTLPWQFLVTTSDAGIAATSIPPVDEILIYRRK